MRIPLVFYTALALGAGVAPAFEPPDLMNRRMAVGSLQRMPVELQRAFDPSGAGYEPIPKPNANDWLGAHQEAGQTFAGFVDSSPNRPSSQRRTIYFQPFGEFTDRAPALDKLRDFARAFFGLEVKMLPPEKIDPIQFSERTNQGSGKPQLLTLDIMAYLRGRVPADAYCVLGLTMEDLYPEPSWNFVFGQASLHDRVGVYSFARYAPEFYGEKLGPRDGELILRRSCRVLAHETGHMFGINHCIYYRCVMNGSNHLEEGDSQPLHLCPLCLRKLQWAVGFKPADRAAALDRLLQSFGLTDEAGWYASQAAAIRGE
jgi:archaemetzincin